MKQLAEKIAPFLSVIPKGQIGVTIVYKTEPKIKKGRSKNSRTESYKRFFNEETGTWNVVKRTVATNLQWGISYENAVNNKAERNGNKERDFKSAEQKGVRYVEYPFLLQSIKNPDTYYLAIYPNKKTKFDPTYFVNGKEATIEEKSIILNDISEVNEESKYRRQHEAGVAEGDEQDYQIIKLSNILEIRQGERVFKF